MISTGAVVRVFRFGATAFVVEGRTLDGRWRVTSKAIDGRNRSTYSSLTVGAGDIVVVREAPTYEVGSAIMHHGAEHIVAADLGSDVKLTAPDCTFRHTTGANLSIPGGNAVTISKSDLILENLT